MLGNFWRNVSDHKLTALSVFITALGLVWAIGWGVFIYIRPTPKAEASTTAPIPSQESAKSDRMYQGSLFVLANKIANEPITIKKEELHKAADKLVAQDSGYVMDIKNISSDEFSEDAYVISIDIIGDDKNGNVVIECLFKESWRQSILSIDPTQKIKFRGKVIGQKNYDSVFANEKSPLIFLGDCSLLE